MACNSDRTQLPEVNVDRSPQIVVNQLGYLDKWPKIALLLNAKENSLTSRFELVDLASNEPVTLLQPKEACLDSASGDVIHSLDFSSVSKHGFYLLRGAGLQAPLVRIGRDAYFAALKKLLRSYYLQRCGIAVEDSATGIAHPPCHVKDGIIAHNDALHKAGDKIKATGGWHDAGDYGKYIATTAVTVGRLLSLFEQYPHRFTDGQLDIPESGNGMPDLLDEMRFGLDWMLTMQRKDGAVYRKLSGKAWPPLIPPDEDTQPRYVYGIFTPEIAKFAASFAIAARVYLPFDSTYANICLKTAQKAWDYLEKNQDFYIDFHEGDNSGSGPYTYSEIDTEAVLLTDVDDRFWAASELFLAVHQQKYHDFMLRHIAGMEFGLFEWKKPASLGMMNYLSRTSLIRSRPLTKVI
ncbi:MAG: glycoside hydrolase family 9 protein [bacterium]